MLSSDGFLKNSVDSDHESDLQSERFVAFPGDTDPKRRAIEDK
jgi:hypothetical protein